MSAAAVPNPLTAEEFASLPPSVGRCELIRGELHTMSPAGGNHGFVTAEFTEHLAAFIRTRKLGRLCAAETGFVLGRKPDTVRAPDIAFIAADRLAQAQVPGFIPIPPDLAVEVNSPSDTASHVAVKVRWWLDHGTRLVWVVDLHARCVTAYHADHTARIYTADETLLGDPVLPGFTLPLQNLFA